MAVSVSRFRGFFGCSRDALGPRAAETRGEYYCQVEPFLVSDGKSTKARPQSTTREASTARVAALEHDAVGRGGQDRKIDPKLTSETNLL